MNSKICPWDRGCGRTGTWMGQTRPGDGSTRPRGNLRAKHGGMKVGHVRDDRAGDGRTKVPKTKTPPPGREAAFCLIMTRKEELLCPWQAWQRPALPGLKPWYH